MPKGQAVTIPTKACPALHNGGMCLNQHACPHDHNPKTIEKVWEAVSKQYQANVDYWPMGKDGRQAPHYTVSMTQGLAHPNERPENIEWPPWKDWAENIDRNEAELSEAEFSDTQSFFEQEMLGIAVPAHPVTCEDFGYSDEEYKDIGGDFPFAEERQP